MTGTSEWRADRVYFLAFSNPTDRDDRIPPLTARSATGPRLA